MNHLVYFHMITSVLFNSTTEISMEPFCIRDNNGIRVSLYWDGPEDYNIYVTDTRTDETFALRATDGRTAMDMYYHPFAYRELSYAAA